VKPVVPDLVGRDTLGRKRDILGKRNVQAVCLRQDIDRYGVCTETLRGKTEEGSHYRAKENMFHF
jgi:hypothetical protein